jgi:hypothetical protein
MWLAEKGEIVARLVMFRGRKDTMVDPRGADIISVYNDTILPKIPKNGKNDMSNVVQRIQNSFVMC